MSKEKSAKAPWWARFIPVKSDSKGELLRKAIFWVATVVFVCSVVYILGVYLESVKTEKLTQELNSMLVEDGAATVEGYPEDYLPKFAALWQRNADIAGWIEIEGTQVNYPVVQGSDNRFYERRDFDGNHNNHGVPFVDFRVDQYAPSTNTVIYAHNMNDGQMFGELMNYKKLAYYKEHPTFRYDSVYKENEYKILGVFLVTANDPEFLYHSMIDLNEAELTEFVNQVRARSLINTKIDVKTTDKLVTLSTCDYSFKDANGNRVARFVVVGRALRPGEDPAVDTSVATLNANPVMPAEWYEQIKRDQEAADLAAAQAAEQAALEQWLTTEEITGRRAEGYTMAQLQQLAEERREFVLEWLTEEQAQTLTAAEKLAAATKLRDRKWLPEEEWTLSEEEKLQRIEENMEHAQQWLTNREIADAPDWPMLEGLIEQRMAEAESSKQQAEAQAKAEAIAGALQGLNLTAGQRELYENMLRSLEVDSAEWKAIVAQAVTAAQTSQSDDIPSSSEESREEPEENGGPSAPGDETVQDPPMP